MLPKAPWKLNVFWLKLFQSHAEIERIMHEFFAQENHIDSPLVQWEAFKAYLRGILIAAITKVKRSSSHSEGAG